ncbi:unnamed protein product [Closterium sp. Naga37s-1]|nr:unnamed protein product [Closterium sp. Naga37s-1]
MRPGAVHQQPDEEEDGEEEEEDGEEGEEREEGEGDSEQYSRTRSKGPEGEEICRVLGGGVVLGSLVLVSGSPGAGKSTLLLQLAGLLAEEARGSLTGGSPLAVLYVSGEEREEQLATRAKRLGITADNLFLLSENNLESILEGITEMEPRAVIVDSIQTMHLPGVTGSLGSVSQVRECTLLLLLEAKNRGIPIFIVGHVTKAGDVAGPRDLKHIVDVVMHVESDRQDSHRILSTSKNRFGSTDEVGVFEMAARGMVAVPNPSLAFLPASRTRGSAAVAVVMHGSRPLLLEVQALCVKAIPNIPPTKTANGVDMYRLTILTKIMRHIGLPIGSRDVVVNVVGGMQVKEPAADLAIAVAIASSLYESPVPADTAFIGEIGLNGELRGVSQLDRRVNEVAKLGFSRCVVPAKQWKGQAAPKGCEVVKCEGLRDVLTAVGIQSTGYGGKRKAEEEELEFDEDDILLRSLLALSPKPHFPFPFFPLIVSLLRRFFRQPLLAPPMASLAAQNLSRELGALSAQRSGVANLPVRRTSVPLAGVTKTNRRVRATVDSSTKSQGTPSSAVSRRSLLAVSLSAATLAPLLSPSLPAFSPVAPAHAADVDLTPAELEAAVRRAVAKVVTRAKAPGALRIVFHDAGTYDLATNTGGMNGSVRFELKRPENDGLKRTIKVLEKARLELGPLANVVSWADLMAVAGAYAVESCGGPHIPVRMGRRDASGPDPENCMPAETLNAKEVVASFKSKGFSLQETVCLLGAHTLGGKGFGDATSFDNAYYSILLTKPWLDTRNSMADMIGLPSDKAIVDDEDCLVWINKYASDQDLFFRDFVPAYTKMVNSGAVWA